MSFSSPPPPTSRAPPASVARCIAITSRRRRRWRGQDRPPVFARGHFQSMAPPHRESLLFGRRPRGHQTLLGTRCAADVALMMRREMGAKTGSMYTLINYCQGLREPRQPSLVCVLIIRDVLLWRPLPTHAVHCRHRKLFFCGSPTVGRPIIQPATWRFLSSPPPQVFCNFLLTPIWVYTYGFLAMLSAKPVPFHLGTSSASLQDVDDFNPSSSSTTTTTTTTITPEDMNIRHAVVSVGALGAGIIGDRPLSLSASSEGRWSHHTKSSSSSDLLQVPQLLSSQDQVRCSLHFPRPNYLPPLSLVYFIPL